MVVSFCGKRLLLHRVHQYYTPKRHGYVVLVPEIGEESSEAGNSLLREDGLLEFSNVTIEKCIGLVGTQAVELEKNVKLLEAQLSTAGGPNDIFKDVIDPLERYLAPLETTWGLAKTLYLGNSTLMPTKSFTTIQDRARKARVAKFNSLPIYNAVKAALLDGSANKYTEEQRRLLEKYLLEGKLNGLDLRPTQKNFDLFTEVMVKLRKEQNKFNANVAKATSLFKHSISDFEEVREFPVEVLAKFATDPKQPLKGPWTVKLTPDNVHSYLEHCSNRTQRWNVWQAENRRASNHAEKAMQNSTGIEEIRFLRRDQAKILGFESYADLSMETKMVSGVSVIKEVINTINDIAKPQQEKELKSLHEYAVQNGGLKSDQLLEFHDIPFWRRKQLQVHNYDDLQIREYFPLNTVLNGLFNLIQDLFHIRIEERQHDGKSFDRWHEDVRYFDIFLADQTSAEPISGFYMDLYTREDYKLLDSGNSGWTIGIRNRSTKTGSNALAALICNFNLESNSGCTLSYSDVNLLFERLGYAMQHLLTQANYCDVAGVSNIEWDAVNISSYVLSSFLQEPNVLKSISSHFKTNDPLPDKLIEAIRMKRRHLAAFDLGQELYRSALDLELHLSRDFWLDIMRRLWPQFQVLPLDKKDSHPCSMTKIFSGPWASAYYSDLWARIVATDVYSAFYESNKTGQSRAEIGKRYRDTFLALGGSCNQNEVFRRFRGRDPSPKALISSLGLKVTVPPKK